MNIINIEINKLNGARYNPRKDLQPGDVEFEKLRKSIETFGYVEPIIYNKRNNVVVGGHQRLKVLKDMGYDEVDAVEVDLDEYEEKALNVTLNKVGGDWDAEKLEDLLRDINLNASFDFDITGFDLSELEIMFSGELVEDEEPEEEDYGLNPDDLGDEFELKSGEKSETEAIRFTLNKNQADLIRKAIEHVIDNKMVHETFGNENKNGNAIYEVVRQWAEQKKLS